jgi:hypothetical protein
VWTRLYNRASPERQAVRCLAGYVAELREERGDAWLLESLTEVASRIADGGYDHLADIRHAREQIQRVAGPEIENTTKAWRFCTPT